MQSIFETGNQTVDRMGRLNIRGNIIPSSWFKTIVKPTGKPNLNAIVILSDIVYWYRPVEIRDEATGRLVGMKKKFRSDLLQRSYQQMAEQFGITKRDATNAVIELERLGVIQRVFRTLTIRGQQMPNILFIKLCVERLVQITYPEQADYIDITDMGEGYPRNEWDVSPNCGYGVPQSGGTICPDLEGGYTHMVGTDTENTETEYNRDYQYLSYQAELARFKEQVGYETMKKDYGDIRKLDELVGVAVDVLTSDAETIRVNRENKPIGVVKAQFRKLSMFHIQFVLKCMADNCTKSRNVRAVMITALYNSVLTINHYYENMVNHDLSEEGRAKGE